MHNCLADTAIEATCLSDTSFEKHRGSNAASPVLEATAAVDADKKVFISKGKAKGQMFEQFIKAGGDKDQFIRRFTLKKKSESSKELDEEGGYYTPEEMKKLLSYSQIDLVDKNIKYYWCRTRVKGLKRLRQTQTAEETAEAEGTGPMMLSGMDKNACTPASMGLRTAADVESAKTEMEKLEIQQKELLLVQEKCSNLRDKLATVETPEKKAMAKSAEKLYERIADALAKTSTSQLDASTPEGAKLLLDLATDGKKLPGRQEATETSKFMADAIGSGPGDDPFDAHSAVAEQREADDESHKQLEMFKPSVRDLPRLRELLQGGLGNDDRVKLRLPRPLLSAGKALLSIRERVASILQLGPTVYKIGLTGDPMFRFYKKPSKTSSSSGYRYDLEQYEEMQVLFAGATWDEAALMEAVLIAEFQGRPGNRNINPGGEGRQVYDPPYFTYIVFKSALIAPKRQRRYAYGGS
ncbi:hypothetical protein AK812_SmicGene24800 [Symbiodinium microadriaticum]|uniref:Uncharacterized protein n=1 Tax=Symbiodinium microadriaticum TaxID=2951 RepID=A0A1Q9DDQ8_SYMMI|nr:hypothetical protein AK812_SmicGene24800 [Symbiodinium microadriaticum]